MSSVPALRMPAVRDAEQSGRPPLPRFSPLKRYLPALLFAAALCPAFTLSEFSGLDLSEDSRLLFTVQSGGEGAPRQKALCLSRIESGSVQALTAWPESLDILEGGSTLQVRNALGAVRIPLKGGLPQSVRGFPSFMTGAALRGGRSEDMAASPDGKWILYVEPVTASSGNLVLIRCATAERIPISSDIERPGAVFPASWSPDSRVFVYARGEKLYFHSVDSTASLTVDERYRQIGDGTIQSLRWGLSGDFFYLRGSAVYRVRASDLFARSLYTGFLEVGSLAGKIPFEFDSNFDSFSVAPDGSALLFSKGGRNLFYYPLGFDDFVQAPTTVLPYLMLPRFCSRVQVLWSSGGIVTVLASFPSGTSLSCQAYRLKTRGATTTWVFESLSVPEDAQAALSPDGSRALVWGVKGLSLYDYINWKPIATISESPCLKALWLGNEEYLLADENRIERRTVAGKTTLICLSSAASYGFDKATLSYRALSGGIWYATDGKEAWNPVETPDLRPVSTASAFYRVYLESLTSSCYLNMPMIRTLKGVGTTSLFPRNLSVFESLEEPQVSGSVDLSLSSVFIHGSRSGRRELSLVFDLIDDAEGLPQVLDTLKRFNVRSTFFLNGEFIRRHPEAARNLVASGHELGSLFFAPIDLSDSRFRIDGAFIKQGLARNEDDFYNATGKELSLLWHPPYYSATEEIAAAAAAAGYRTVGRDFDSLDWVTRADSKKMPGMYKSATQLVDRIVELKKPGSIIPIRLGLPSTGRDDYLFNRLDILIDELVRSGYELVPVSSLVEHSR